MAIIMSCVGTFSTAQLNQVTVVGAVTPGNCAKFLTTLQLQDAGGACGGAGGGVAFQAPPTANDCVKAVSNTVIADQGAPCGTGTVTVSGTTPVTGNCVKWASPTAIQDVGAVCGTGGGGVTTVFGRSGAVVAAANDYNFNQLAGTASLTTQVAGILPAANGGNGVANPTAMAWTGTGAPTFAFPAGAATYTFPAASATLLSTAALNLSATPLTTTGTGAPTLAFPNAARTYTYPQTNSVLLSNADVVGSANPGTPTGSGGAMMGLGVASCRFTPANSTRMLFVISGDVSNSGATGLAGVQLRFGSGAGPANGTAATGTALTAAPANTTNIASGGTPFALIGVGTGLVAGTTYWSDILTSNGGSGTITVNDLTCVGVEL